MAAGYSGTPLAQKLGLKPDHQLRLLGAPAAWTVSDLPSGVRVTRSRRPAGAEVTIAFYRQLSRLQADAADLAAALGPENSLWLAWPRRAGGHVSDITDTEVRAALLPTGLVDTKVAALDEDWSGLKFVWRKELRGG